jgi:hypothetical protein
LGVKRKKIPANKDKVIADSGSKRSETPKSKKYIRKNRGENRAPVEKTSKKTTKDNIDTSKSILNLNKFEFFLVTAWKIK